MQAISFESAMPQSLGELIAISLATPLPVHASSSVDGVEREAWLSCGELTHARHGNRVGIEAVVAMLDEAHRPFVVALGRVAPQRTIEIPWRRLCHEARCALLDAPAQPATATRSDVWVDIAVDDLLPPPIDAVG